MTKLIYIFKYFGTLKSTLTIAIVQSFPVWYVMAIKLKMSLQTQTVLSYNSVVLNWGAVRWCQGAASEHFLLTFRPILAPRCVAKYWYLAAAGQKSWETQPYIDQIEYFKIEFSNFFFQTIAESPTLNVLWPAVRLDVPSRLETFESDVTVKVSYFYEYCSKKLDCSITDNIC